MARAYDWLVDEALGAEELLLALEPVSVALPLVLEPVSVAPSLEVLQLSSDEVSPSYAQSSLDASVASLVEESSVAADWSATEESSVAEDWSVVLLVAEPVSVVVVAVPESVVATEVLTAPFVAAIPSHEAMKSVTLPPAALHLSRR